MGRTPGPVPCIVHSSLKCTREDSSSLTIASPLLPSMSPFLKLLPTFALLDSVPCKHSPDVEEMPGKKVTEEAVKRSLGQEPFYLVQEVWCITWWWYGFGNQGRCQCLTHSRCLLQCVPGHVPEGGTRMSCDCYSISLHSSSNRLHTFVHSFTDSVPFPSSAVVIWRCAWNIISHENFAENDIFDVITLLLSQKGLQTLKLKSPVSCFRGSWIP